MHASGPVGGWLAEIAPRRVAVFRALQLGDMLCAVPALRAIRHALPAAHISLIGLPWAAAFARRFSDYLDGFLAFPGHTLLPEQPAPDPAAALRFSAEARAQGFDLVIQLHGDGHLSNAIAAGFGARWLAGFVPVGGEGEVDMGLPYPDWGPEVRRLLALADALGAPSQTEQLTFPIGEADQMELAQFEAQLPGLAEARRQRYVCLHPGARSADKRWPPERFAEVGDALHQRYGVTSVLTGSDAERDLTEAVAERMQTPVVNAAGGYSVGALAALIAGAALLVCNDTGASHLAAALRVPSVVIFISTNADRWAPLDSSLHRVVHDPRKQAGKAVLTRCIQLMEPQSPSLGAPADVAPWLTLPLG